jgi:hypothetical protein
VGSACSLRNPFSPVPIYKCAAIVRPGTAETPRAIPRRVMSRLHRCPACDCLPLAAKRRPAAPLTPPARAGFGAWSGAGSGERGPGLGARLRMGDRRSGASGFGGDRLRGRLTRKAAFRLCGSAVGGRRSLRSRPTTLRLSPHYRRKRPADEASHRAARALPHDRLAQLAEAARSSRADHRSRQGIQLLRGRLFLPPARDRGCSRQALRPLDARGGARAARHEAEQLRLVA